MQLGELLTFVMQTTVCIAFIKYMFKIYEKIRIKEYDYNNDF